MTRRGGLVAAAWAVAALLALNGVLLMTQPGLAATQALADYFLGPRMVRAEIIVQDGGVLHDYRFDRGRIRAVGGATITLLEADGTIATIPVAPTAQVTLNGRAVALSALRRGMRALTIRDGGAPAHRVQATRR